MLDLEEIDDPLTDPFASIGDDPLNQERDNGFESSSSGEVYQNHLKLNIPTSITQHLTIHKIPVSDNGLTITRIDSNSVFNNQIKNYNGDDLKMPKKRGRKKGSKNKFKRGVPILPTGGAWEECALTFNNGSMVIKKVGGSENFADQDLALILNGRNGSSEIGRVKRKYTKRIKLDPYVNTNFAPQHYEDPPAIREASRVIVELDPAHFFPDEPYPRQRRRRNGGKGKRAKWAALPHHCSICGKGFKGHKGLLAHKSLKHGIEDLTGCYPCECCEQVFQLKRDLAQHLPEHVDGSGRLPCPECGAREPDVAQLARHKAHVHPHLGTLGRNWFHTWGDR